MFGFFRLPDRTGRRHAPARPPRERRGQEERTEEPGDPELEHRIRELAFLNSGVSIHFNDLRGPEPFAETLYYEGGVKAYVTHLDRSRTGIIPDVIYVIGGDLHTVIPLPYVFQDVRR